MFTTGARVRSTGAGWARMEGTVRRVASRPPGTDRDSGPWYVVAWDAAPGIGQPAQEGLIEASHLEGL